MSKSNETKDEGLYTEAREKMEEHSLRYRNHGLKGDKKPKIVEVDLSDNVQVIDSNPSSTYHESASEKKDRLAKACGGVVAAEFAVGDASLKPVPEVIDGSDSAVPTEGAEDRAATPNARGEQTTARQDADAKAQAEAHPTPGKGTPPTGKTHVSSVKH